MADTGTRVEVRYGAFSCTIEGCDDAVGQLREVLALMQRMIAETPALADADLLDDEQFARLDDALADWRARADDEGVIIVRSGHRVAGDVGDVGDAESLADAAQDEEGRAGPRQADQADADLSGPPPSAAIFSAPAAAVAEAAFAAGMASGEADTPQPETPLGSETPGEAATQAALFAAPAAEVADRTSPAGPSAAEPADPDDDAEDAVPLWQDEAAEERLQDAETAAASRFAGDAGPDGPLDADGPLSEGLEPAAAPSAAHDRHRRARPSTDSDC